MQTNQLACPDPLDIARQIATSNPRAALWLARTRPMLGIYSMSATIANGATGQPIELALPSMIAEDFFITDLVSEVERPSAFAGSIFKAQSDVNNAMNPGIHAKFQVTGGPAGSKYLINENYAPLQLVAPNVNSGRKSPLCSQNFVLQYAQSLKGSIVLRRTYTQDELPTLVTVAMVGWSLGCQQFDGITEVVARAALGDEFGDVLGLPAKGR